MKMNCTLPKGLSSQSCKRSDPIRMGGIPLIRFVPHSSVSSEEVGEEGEKIKISFTNTIQKYVKVFKEGGAEAVIQLICQHDLIAVDCKLV